MIILTGTFEVAVDDTDAYLGQREELVRRSRAEEGCLTYGFYADPLVPGRIVLLEKWATAEAFEAHRELLRTAPLTVDVPVISAEVLRYTAEPMG